MERFSQYLRDKADPIWRKIASHPFILGVGDGSLPIESFEFYIRQDYLFLIEFSRLLALGAAKAGSLKVMELFARRVHMNLSGLKDEMTAYKDFCRRLEISMEELVSTPMAPTTLAYTSYLVKIGYGGTMGEVLAALMPCPWSYRELKQGLRAKGLPEGHPFYCEWITIGSSPEFAQLLEEFRNLLDQYALGAGEEEKARMEQHFLTISRYEYMFWDMANRQEQWPV